MSARALLRGLRPAQWWKNVPVGAALLFGRRAEDPGAVAATLATFVAFCGVAGAGYLVNDVVDRASDRAHPLRRDRPVARGDLSVRAALVAAGFLGGGTLVVAALALPKDAVLPLAAYALASLGYTLGLRRVPGLGAPVLAAGFALRVVAGAGAARVVPSPWLVGLMVVLALALAVAKREAEERRLRAPAEPTGLARATDGLLLASGLGYLAYTLAPGTVALHGTRGLALTAVPVALALLRFRGRLRSDRTGSGPAELVARDPVVLALGAAWAGACAWVLHAAG